LSALTSSSTNRRRFNRFGFDALALLRIGSNARTPCRLLDLSLNGALVELDEPLPVSGRPGKLGLVVRGLVRGDTVTMSMDVEPVHDGNCRVGCRIINIDADSFTNLKLLIQDNHGDVGLLDRELTQLDYWPGGSL